MVVQSGAHSPELPGVNIGNFETEKQDEQAEAAVQFSSLVDSLLKDIEPEEGTQDKHLALVERIVDMNNYLSVFVVSKSGIDVQSDTDGGLTRLASKHILLEKTYDGRAQGARIYELIGDEATWREEGDDTPAGEGKPVSLDDIRSLEDLLGYHVSQDKFAA